MLDDITAQRDAMFHPEWLGVDPTSDPHLALRFLFHDCDLQSQQWALGTLRLLNPGRPSTSTRLPPCRPASPGPPSCPPPTALSSPDGCARRHVSAWAPNRPRSTQATARMSPMRYRDVGPSGST
jgi:hypothetical protein